MKTTIRAGDGLLIAEPSNRTRMVQITINETEWGEIATIDLTEDEIGAFIQAMEKALEAARIAADRLTA